MPGHHEQADTYKRRDVKKAYHKLALRWHPDKVAEGEKAEAEKKMQEINAAFETLEKIFDRREKGGDTGGPATAGGTAGEKQKSETKKRKRP